MGSLAGYIASVCVGIAVAYLSQFLTPKIKIRFWLSHSFLYTVPLPLTAQPALPAPAGATTPAGQLEAPGTFQVQTHSLTI